MTRSFATFFLIVNVSIIVTWKIQKDIKTLNFKSVLHVNKLTKHGDLWRSYPVILSGFIYFLIAEESSGEKQKEPHLVSQDCVLKV